MKQHLYPIAQPPCAAAESFSSQLIEVVLNVLAAFSPILAYKLQSAAGSQR